MSTIRETNLRVHQETITRCLTRNYINPIREDVLKYMNLLGTYSQRLSKVNSDVLLNRALSNQRLYFSKSERPTWEYVPQTDNKMVDFNCSVIIKVCNPMERMSEYLSNPNHYVCRIIDNHARKYRVLDRQVNISDVDYQCEIVDDDEDRTVHTIRFTLQMRLRERHQTIVLDDTMFQMIEENDE